jgi:hypothetical protein
VSTTLTVTPYPAGTPGPYIDVLAESFDAGVATVTVWRTVGTRTWRVRGLINVSASGIVTTRDFEAPPDRPSVYRVEQFDASGVFLSWSTTATTTLPGDPGYAYIHNPFDPSTTVKVKMAGGAADEITRPIDAEVFRIRGRSVGVAIFSARRGVTKVSLDCITETEADADKFDLLFGDYDDDDTVPILCVRAPKIMRLPPTLFALIGEPGQRPFNFHRGGESTQWKLSGDEIAPPPEAIITSLLGYDDFTAFYSDYAAFTSAYADYRAATRDYSIAGTV